MAARTYKRDSNGRFASGSGGSSGGGKSGAKKTAASKPAAKKPAAAKPAASKPATDGRRGPRGGKTGTRAEQRKAAAAQAARSAEFRGKATAGRGAKDAYKAAARGARMSEKGAAKKAGRVKATLRPNKPNVSMAAMQRRSAKVSDAAILERRQRADTWRDEMAFRSGQYPKSPQKRADYAARSTQAEMNRRQNALVTAQRARDFYAAAAFSASNFSLRQRFSTAAPSRNRPLPALTSYFSAWRGYSYKPSKAKKRN